MFKNAKYKKTILLILTYLLLEAIVYCEVRSNTIDINFIRNNIRKLSKFQVNKNPGRMLTDKDIVIEYEENRDFFTTTLEIGSPAQNFEVQIDTTTSVSWVPSINCEDCNSTSRYNASASHTSKSTNKTIKIEDEDGDVKGYKTYDTINLDGLTVDEYGFIQVTKYEEDENIYEDGKLGLGYRDQYGEKFSLLDALKNKGLISKKIFSLSETNHTHGKLHIGDFPSEYSRDTSRYSYCNLTSTDDLDEDYRDSWVCEISHLLIGKAENLTDATEIENGQVIFDSAYGYISAPKKYLHFFKQDLLAKESNKLNCLEVTKDDVTSFTCTKRDNSTSFADIDDVNFIMGGFAYSIDAEDLFEPMKDGSSYEFLIKFYKQDDNVWSFGYPFMSQYLVVFNAEDDHVGFFGGEKIDFQDEWNDWLNGYDKGKENQMFYLMVGAAILGALLFILLLFIIFHSIRKRRLEEHGPLINERN